MPKSEQEIIVEAIDAFGFHELHTDSALLQALESFYLNGSADEQDGDADTFGHFYRVDRWIVHTNSQGFHDLVEFSTEDLAKDEFNKLSAKFGSDDWT